jgi:hypothetical protein
MNAPEQRLLVSTTAKFSVRDAYKNLTCTGVQVQNSINIWRAKIPNKVKIFSWLFFKDRLSTRTNLFRKNVLDDDKCQRCGSCVLVATCSLVVQAALNFWTALQLVSIISRRTDMLWCMSMPPEAPQLVWPDVVLTILWRIWEARNGFTFRAEVNRRRIISTVCDDLDVWSHHYSKPLDKEALRRWRSFLRHCNST